MHRLGPRVRREEPEPPRGGGDGECWARRRPGRSAAVFNWHHLLDRGARLRLQGHVISDPLATPCLSPHVRLEIKRNLLRAARASVTDTMLTCCEGPLCPVFLLLRFRLSDSTRDRTCPIGKTTMSIHALLVAARLATAVSLTQLRGEKILAVVDSHGPVLPDSAHSAHSGGDAPTEQDLRSYSGDWLFHVRTTSCRGDVFDNGTYTYTSRAFLPLLFGCCAIVLFLTRQGDGGKMEGGEPGGEPAGEPGGTSEVTTGAAGAGTGPTGPTAGRLWHVDFARICAVMCVIFEHCGASLRGSEAPHLLRLCARALSRALVRSLNATAQTMLSAWVR